MQNDQAARLIRITCRALGRHGLAHAYGHCSIRLDDEHMLVSPAKALGLVRPEDACITVPINGPFPEGLLGEVRIHREIYKRRKDVQAIVRCQPPKSISLSAIGKTPKPRHGFGSYFWPAPPFWSDPQLLRNDERAAELAELMGNAKAIVMRGNGVVTAGKSLEESLVLAWYLEDAARVELDCLASGTDLDEFVLSETECAKRAVYTGQILNRMWDYLIAGDPENT